jgi:hypothetical protein
MTRGQFASPAERVKDVIVDQLREYFRLTAAPLATGEKPNIAKYGVYGDPETSDDAAVQIVTALPHADQRVPSIVVVSASGTEKKLGIGRQVIATFHDPISGQPVQRLAAAWDMRVVIEVSAGDTNTRSELGDHVAAFFGMYKDREYFSFLGSAVTDPVTGDQNLWQMILRTEVQQGDETEVPRPGNEGFDKFYNKRLTVPLLFIDYIDREAWDVAVVFNPALTAPDPDVPFPLGTPSKYMFVNSDGTFETGFPYASWAPTETAEIASAIITEGTLTGVGSFQWSRSVPNMGTAVLANLVTPGVLTGRLRCRVRFDDPGGSLALTCLAQPTPDGSFDPMTSAGYWLLFRTLTQSRILLCKGPVVLGDPVAQGLVIAESSVMSFPVGSPMAVQLQWTIDPKRNKTFLQGFFAPYSLCWQDLQQRLGFVDNAAPFLTSLGETLVYRPDDRDDMLVSGDVGSVTVDDIELLVGL